MHQQLLSMPRRSGGRNVIAVASDFGVWAGGFFWVWVFFNLIGPTWPATIGDIPRTVLETALTLLLGSCMAFVTPALWSSVLPGTSAGMLLQSAQRRTLGFVALLAASLFLAYLSFQVIQSWWSSRPAVVESGLVNALTLTSLIFFVLVPALAWSWSTPAAWLHEIEQDHKVRQLRMAQETELALAKAGYSRALMIMSAGLDNATMQQREYVAGVVMAIHRGRNEQLRQVAGHLQALTGVEASLAWRDDQLIDQLEQVRTAITSNEQAINEEAVSYYEQPQPPMIAPAMTHALTRELSRDQAATGSPPRELSRELSPAPVAEQDAEREPVSAEAEAWQALNLAYQSFDGQAWKREQLEKLLNIKQTKALALIRGWIEDGQVVALDNPKHHYEFTRMRGE